METLRRSRKSSASEKSSPNCVRLRVAASRSHESWPRTMPTITETTSRNSTSPSRSRSKEAGRRCSSRSVVFMAQAIAQAATSTE